MRSAVVAALDNILYSVATTNLTVLLLEVRAGLGGAADEGLFILSGVGGAARGLLRAEGDSPRLANLKKSLGYL